MKNVLEIKLLVNEQIKNAEFALNQASSATLIDVCQKYLSLLQVYREDLNKFRKISNDNPEPVSGLMLELVEQTQKVIQEEEENTEQKLVRTEALLRSFTTMTGYEAVKTFNQIEYKGFKDWELRADEVRLKDDANGEKLSVGEAIELAGELRRKAFVIYKTTFLD